MQYERYGNKKGPLLVFLHGGGVGAWMWTYQLDAFTDYHCIVPHLQGHHPRSDEASFSIAGNADEVLEIIQQYDKGQDIFLVGFSIGSQIAIELMSRAPHLITKAMLNSPLITPSKWMAQLTPLLVKWSFPLIRRRAFAKLQAKQLYIGEALFEDYFADSNHMRQEILVQVLQENSLFTVPSDFSHIGTEILATVGEKERRIMKKSVKVLADLHPNCQSVMIPAIGHGFPLARPDQFNRMLKEFLTSSSSS